MEAAADRREDRRVLAMRVHEVVVAPPQGREVAREQTGVGEASGPEIQPLQQEFYQYFRDSCVPEPISRDAQRELDDQEEKDNKEKERQARQAQKELEQRKARQKADAQLQLLKQQ